MTCSCGSSGIPIRSTVRAATGARATRASLVTRTRRRGSTGWRAPWARGVVGRPWVDATVGGAGIELSRGFGVAGMVTLQPCLQGGLVFVNALSSVIDFKPAAENQANPTADDGIFRNISFVDNRYLRGALGLRLVAGVVVLGAE